MVELYRSMKVAADGLPEPGPSARTLGVRPGRDVSALADTEMVQPGSGGLSVTPDDPMRLPDYRRPKSLGGRGQDPVWMISDADLSADLMWRADPNKPADHGFIEPNRTMALQEYQDALANTRSRWQLVCS